MLRKLFLVFVFLSTIEFIVSDDELSAYESTVWGPPLTYKELYFYKDKKTDDKPPRDQLNCLPSDSLCKKYPLSSVKCHREGKKSFRCYSWELPILIRFDNPKVWCKVHPSTTPDKSVYQPETCYLEYKLAYHWVEIIVIIVLTLIFLPCVIFLTFYLSTLAYMSIRKNVKKDKVLIV